MKVWVRRERLIFGFVVGLVICRKLINTRVGHETRWRWCSAGLARFTGNSADLCGGEIGKFGELLAR